MCELCDDIVLSQLHQAKRYSLHPPEGLEWVSALVNLKLCCQAASALELVEIMVAITCLTTKSQLTIPSRLSTISPAMVVMLCPHRHPISLSVLRRYRHNEVRKPWKGPGSDMFGTSMVNLTPGDQWVRHHARTKHVAVSWAPCGGS